MMYGWHDGGWGIVWMILSWGVIIALVWAALRAFTRDGDGANPRAPRKTCWRSGSPRARSTPTSTGSGCACSRSTTRRDGDDSVGRRGAIAPGEPAWITHTRCTAAPPSSCTPAASTGRPRRTSSSGSWAAPGCARGRREPGRADGDLTFDPQTTSIAELQGWIRDCGSTAPASRSRTTSATRWRSRRPQARPPAAEHAGHAAAAMPTPHEVMGHGGHAGDVDGRRWSRDMRNRFLVAAMLLGADPAVVADRPRRARLHGRRRRSGCATTCSQLLLSLPVIFYSAWIFFDGACRALRARTLDMMVLVAVAVGAGWLYSRRRHAHRRRRGVLRGRHRADRVRAARALVRDARPRRRQRRDPHAARPRPADGAWSSATASRSRSRPPRSSSATCCWSGPGRRSPVDGDGRGRRERGRRVDGHRREPAGAQGSRARRSSARRSTRNGTLRVRATKVGADTALAQIVQARPGGAELQGARAAAGRPGRVLAGARRADRRRRAPSLVVARRRRRPSTTAMLFAITVVVITCPDALGPGHADRDHGRHRPRRQARRPVQERHRARDLGPHRHRRDGQDRHAHQGRARGHRRRRRRASTRPSCCALAAAVERESEHPLAEAIVRHADARGVAAAERRRSSRTCPATARVATVDGRRVAVGNRAPDGPRGRRPRAARRARATSSPPAGAPRCSSPSTAERPG